MRSFPMATDTIRAPTGLRPAFQPSGGRAACSQSTTGRTTSTLEGGKRAFPLGLGTARLQGRAATAVCGQTRGRTSSLASTPSRGVEAIQTPLDIRSRRAFQAHGRREAPLELTRGAGPRRAVGRIRCQAEGLKTIGRVARCELRPLRLRYECESRQGCERPGCADRRGAEAPRNAADVVTRARSSRRLSLRRLRRPDRRRPRHLRLAALSRLPQRSAAGLGAPDEDAAAGRKRELGTHEDRDAWDARPFV